MEIDIRQVSPRMEEVRRLFKLLDSHNMSHCPPEVCNLIQPEELENIDSILLGIFCDEVLCGMGGLKYHQDYAEVTRMFVKKEFRGNGFSVQLLRKLESIAMAKNMTALKLETSNKFKPAICLYNRYGFSLCEPFGEYIKKPYNTYMVKIIEASI